MMPEWNGMEDFKNGMEDNLPNQFHTKFLSWHLQENLISVLIVITKNMWKRLAASHLPTN